MGFRKILIVFLVILPFFAFNGFHKFYVSYTEMNYKSGKEQLQITTRIFADDFQKTMRERYDPSLNYVKGNTTKKAEAYLVKYYNEKVKLSANGKQLKLKFIGERYEDGQIICYFEADGVKAFNKMKVTNLLLTGAFPKQKNIVHLNNKGQNKSLLLKKAKPNGILSY